MVLLWAVPAEIMVAVAQLDDIGQCLRSACAAAAGPTTAVAAAGGDEISVALAALLGAHGQDFQRLNAAAGVFHQDFVSALGAAGRSYSAAEAASASPLAGLLALVNAPTEALLGRPLIGNGAPGTPGTGDAGGAGGLLIGNGGAGGSG
ncbi:PE family protein, partial [Mycobacterium pseudokansasii]